MANGHGGSRPNAGRKPKAEEQQVIERFGPLADKTFRVIENGLDNFEPWAAKIVVEYLIGKPTQRQEISGPSGGPIPYADWTEEQIKSELDRLREHT